jgi:hypothetical protein
LVQPFLQYFESLTERCAQDQYVMSLLRNCQSRQSCAIVRLCRSRYRKLFWKGKDGGCNSADVPDGADLATVVNDPRPYNPKYCPASMFHRLTPQNPSGAPVRNIPASDFQANNFNRLGFDFRTPQVCGPPLLLTCE